MLIKCTFSNFRSFREEQTLNFLADMRDGQLVDERLAENTFEFQGARILKAVALFGANASGKTNVLKALEHLANQIRSTQFEPSVFGAHKPYKLDKESKQAPSNWQIQFYFGETAYEYRLLLRPGIIECEELSIVRYDSVTNSFGVVKESDRIFRRTSTQVTEPRKSRAMIELFDSYQPSLDIEEDKTILQGVTKPHELMLGSLLELATESPHSYMIDSLRRNCTLLDRSYDFGLLTDIMVDMEDYASRKLKILGGNLKPNPVITFLNEMDIEVSDIILDEEKLKGKVLAMQDFIEEINLEDKMLRKSLSKQRLNRHVPRLYEGVSKRFLRKLYNDAGFAEFSFHEEESLGAQRLYNLLWIIVSVLEDGNTLLFDEIDASLHPLLSRKIVSYFLRADTNPNRAQLVYTTHDVAHFDLNFLRRDQIWICEKDRLSGGSKLRSLAEITADWEGEDLQDLYKDARDLYLAGAFDGVPVVMNYFTGPETKEEA